MTRDTKPQRGKLYDCGMGIIPLGDGVMSIAEIGAVLKQSGFDGATTLEVFGPESVKTSAARLKHWWGN